MNTAPSKRRRSGVPSYDDKQAAARLSQCLGCFLWFWFTAKPAPDYCVKCREEGRGEA